MSKVCMRSSCFSNSSSSSHFCLLLLTFYPSILRSFEHNMLSGVAQVPNCNKHPHRMVIGTYSSANNDGSVPHWTILEKIWIIFWNIGVWVIVWKGYKTSGEQGA